jgi:hypothetical protein
MKPCDTEAFVVTQIIEAGNKVRHEFEMVTKVAGISLNRFSTWGFGKIVNHQLGFLGMKLK